VESVHRTALPAKARRNAQIKDKERFLATLGMTGDEGFATEIGLDPSGVPGCARIPKAGTATRERTWRGGKIAIRMTLDRQMCQNLGVVQRERAD
jgi:hypothetical protein